MKTIRLCYVDFWGGFNPEHFKFTKILRKEYDIIIDSQNPDYVICGCFGEEFLKYNCIRIAFLSEAMSPDFNLYDYVIGCEYISFGDRYVRYPLYVFNEKELELAMNKHKNTDDFFREKKKFCNFVVSNGNAMSIREEFFERLSEYCKVDSGGRYKNNLEDGKPVKNKLEFQKQYRFSLAFENSCLEGYITEKIIQAWAAGTIPIYYGDSHIAEEFNEKSYIDVSKFPSIEEAVTYIATINENMEEYMRMVREPIFTEEQLKNQPDYELALQEFFNNIFSRDDLRRTSKKTMWAAMYEEKIKNSYAKNRSKLVAIAYRISKILGRS